MIYTSDSGLDCVFVIEEDTASFFGKDLLFLGLNSLVVDDAGNMIVSDGLNYKLKVVSKHHEYLGLIKVKNGVKDLLKPLFMFVFRWTGNSQGQPCCPWMRRGRSSSCTTSGAGLSTDTRFRFFQYNL